MGEGTRDASWAEPLGNLDISSERVYYKILMLGKNRGQEEKGAPEDEIVGWHHRLKVL